MQEAEVARHLLVEQAQRARHSHLTQQLEAGAVPHEVRRGRELTASVERHDGGLLERRGEKCARRVRDVVRHEVPAERSVVLRTAEMMSQVQRRAMRELSWRVHNVRQKKRIPWRVPRRLVRAGLERERDRRVVAMRAEEQRRIERVCYMIDLR